MLRKNINAIIRRLEADLGNAQEKYVSSIKSHENDKTLNLIRDDILTKKFELKALYDLLNK